MEAAIYLTQYLKVSIDFVGIHYRYGMIWICIDIVIIVIPSTVKTESCLPRVLGTLSRVLELSWSKRWQAGRGLQKKVNENPSVSHSVKIVGKIHENTDSHVFFNDRMID